MALIDELIAAADAQKQLESAGSVMAKERYQPGRLGIIGDVISELLTKLNPVDWMGGPTGAGQAVLGPIRTAGQKQIAKAMFRLDPELLKEAVASKRMLHIANPQSLEEAVKTAASGAPKAQRTPELIRAIKNELLNNFPQYGNYGIYQDALNPSFGGTVTINPNLLRGRSPTGTISSTTGLPQVAAHELTHFLTAPQTKALTEGQGYEAASVLRDFLSQHGKDVVSEHLARGETERAASEALSYLSEVLNKPGNRAGKDIFKELRPELPTPPAGATGTFGGISGMGVENKPLYQTLKDLGVIKAPESSLWSDVAESLKQMLGGKQ